MQSWSPMISLLRNLISNDTSNVYAVFVKDTQTGKTFMVSTNWSGIHGNNNSGNAHVAAIYVD